LVATSAALGLPIAAANTVGYLIAGLRQTDLRHTRSAISTCRHSSRSPPPALAAPAGARMAHRWPVARLRRAFAALLYVIASFFIWKVFAH
jgi:uncharacterized membrane protein YfcA